MAKLLYGPTGKLWHRGGKLLYAGAGGKNCCCGDSPQCPPNSCKVVWETVWHKTAEEWSSPARIIHTCHQSEIPDGLIEDEWVKVAETDERCIYWMLQCLEECGRSGSIGRDCGTCNGQAIPWVDVTFSGIQFCPKDHATQAAATGNPNFTIRCWWVPTFSGSCRWRGTHSNLIFNVPQSVSYPSGNPRWAGVGMVNVERATFGGEIITSVWATGGPNWSYAGNWPRTFVGDHGQGDLVWCNWPATVSAGTGCGTQSALSASGYAGIATLSPHFSGDDTVPSGDCDPDPPEPPNEPFGCDEEDI